MVRSQIYSNFKKIKRFIFLRYLAMVFLMVPLLSFYYLERSFLPAQARLTDEHKSQRADSNRTYKEQTSICPLPEKGIYKMVSLSCPGKILDVSSAGRQNGVNVQLWEPNATQGQKWLIEHVEGLDKDCFYKITAKHSGKVLEVINSGKENGVNVHQWEWNDTDTQKWRIERLGENNQTYHYKITAKHSGKVLDVSQSLCQNGANVQQWSSNQSDAQKWRLIPVNLKKAFYGDTENCDLKGKMPLERFEHLKQRIRDAGFDDEKQKILLSAAKLRVLSSEQVAELIKNLDFDNHRLALSKRIYPYVLDPENYFIVVKELVFESHRKELRDFLEVTNPQREMTPERFEHLKQQISDAGFDDEKQKILFSVAKFRTLSSNQVAELVKVFDFDNHRIALSKRMYPYVLDPENYFLVVKALVFESSRKELRDFLEVTDL